MLCLAQDFVIKGQNTIVSIKTEIRKATNAAISELSRTPAESAAQSQQLKQISFEPARRQTVWLLDKWRLSSWWTRTSSKPTEQTKPYQNRGARVAMNDTFHLLSKDAADWSGPMAVKLVFTKLQSTWTRVMSVAASSVQLPISMLVPEAADPDLK